MKHINDVNTIEEILSATARKNDSKLIAHKSISPTVMSQLRQEKLIDDEYSMIWEIILQPLATCITFACIALACSILYFSSNSYDDKIIELLFNSNEQGFYTTLGDI